MPRPRKPPHELYRADKGYWVIADGQKYIIIEPRLHVDGPPDDEAARLAVARYVVAQATKAAQAPGATPAVRPASDVRVEEVLYPYVLKRTDADPLIRTVEVARPNEVRQRAKAMLPLWSHAITGLTEQLLRDWAQQLGSDSYARRCLAELQAAINEARAIPLFHEDIRIWKPSPPSPRQDHLTFEEVVYLILVCWRHRDSQQRRVGGHFEIVDGAKRLVGGRLEEVGGSQRPWAHIVRFIAVAIATCSRSSRVYEASYKREAGRPWVDLSKGVLHRQAPGTRQTTKRAPTVDLSPRLVAAMRRWSSDRVVAGKLVKGDRYVVQTRSRAVDCKKGYVLAVETAVAAARRDDAARVAAGLEPRGLFLRDDGEPKQVVRHTLRHTGVTWLAETPGVDVEDVCSYAGMTREMFDRVYGHAHRARSKKIVAAQSKKPRRPKKKDD